MKNVKKVIVKTTKKEYKLYQLAKKSGFLDLMKATEGLSDAKVAVQVKNGKFILPQSAKLNETVFDILVYGNKKIYDKTYNKMKLLLTKNVFLKEIERVRKNYNIPTAGLKKIKNLKKWSNEMEKKFRSIKRKVKFLKIDPETKEIERRSKSVYFSKFEENLANNIKTFILKKFHLSEEFLEPIRWLILHNNLEYSTSAFEIKLKRNQIGENELWLKILPQTKKQDIIQLWDRIKLFQQYLPDYRKRLKERPNIERDYEIYNLYKKYRKELGSRKRAKTIKYLLQEEMPADAYISDKIKKEYPNITLSNIRKIISRFKKKFSDI